MNVIDHTDIVTGVKWLPDGDADLESFPNWQAKRYHDFAYAQGIMRELEDQKIEFVAYVFGRDLDGDEEWTVQMRKLRVPRV